MEEYYVSFIKTTYPECKNTSVGWITRIKIRSGEVRQPPKKWCFSSCQSNSEFCIADPCPEQTQEGFHCRCSIGTLTPDEKEVFEELTNIRNRTEFILHSENECGIQTIAEKVLHTKLRQTYQEESSGSRFHWDTHIEFMKQCEETAQQIREVTRGKQCPTLDRKTQLTVKDSDEIPVNVREKKVIASTETAKTLTGPKPPIDYDKIVRAIYENHPETRAFNSSRLLLYLQNYGKKNGVDITISDSRIRQLSAWKENAPQRQSGRTQYREEMGDSIDENAVNVNDIDYAIDC